MFQKLYCKCCRNLPHFANHLVIKVDISKINSDKLSHSYDDLYLCITFLETQGILLIINMTLLGPAVDS